MALTEYSKWANFMNTIWLDPFSFSEIGVIINDPGYLGFLPCVDGN